MSSSKASNESLADRLIKAEVYDDFCALMFGQRMRYEDLLEQLEKWSLSSSMGGLHRFSEAHRSQWILARAKAQHEAMLHDAGTTLDAAQRKLVAENLFNLAASPEVSDKTLLKMRDQEIKLAELAHDKLKIEQAERKLEQAQELIEMQKAKIAEMKAEAERQRQAAEDAIAKANKDGGMTDETVKVIRRAMGMKVEGDEAKA
jgi:hypothetical protein